MLHVRTTTRDAVFLLSPLTVFGNRNVMIANSNMITITPTPFQIYILADNLLILCRMYLRIRGVLYF